MKKRVRFTNEMIQVSMQSPPTEEDRRNSWYQNYDFQSFKKDIYRNLIALRKVHGNIATLNPEKYCLRGLETKLCRRYSNETKAKQAAVVRMVLELQNEQKASGKSNPEELKMFSMMCSKLSRDQAAELGVMDAKIASTPTEKTVHKREFDDVHQQTELVDCGFPLAPSETKRRRLIAV
eukprot:CAMPEP_0202450684 /NCGR_PEP_ID=MMETSP1360-20130828/9265_1 /ASSEMBLY_ACC=CAM_ASM_000848 /TAXON_ID=515479 /ORGANISM="Licmophora paradoxa, Strain CCMP2313" /LENGTH=178 /DNA_ID=CAMNT_0049069047 /DNA_START=20 /DNA_END=556 /DNA_ORIENTATION=+